MTCPRCKTALIWGNDFDFEDYGLEGEGIVGVYTCHLKDCDVDTVIIETPFAQEFIDAHTTLIT